MKKVIIVNDFDYIQGGASNVAISSYKILKEAGKDVIFFSGVSNNKEDKKCFHSINDKEIAKGQNKVRNIFNRKAIKELKKLINKEDEYIIWIHGWTKSLSSSIFKIGKLENVKVYLTVHDYFSMCPNGGFFNYKKNIICKCKGGSCKCLLTNCDSRNYAVKVYRYIRHFVQNKIVKFYKYIDMIISISEFSEKIIKKYIKNIPVKRVYNPVDIDKTQSTSSLKHSNEYVYIGRLDKEKGVYDVCEAAARTGVLLNVIGDGTERVLLENKYKDNKNIVFKGWLQHETAMYYLNKSRCLIFPSLWYEGAPLTIFESIYFCVPSIISDCSAATDFINNRNGFVYNTGNVEELIAAIKLSKNDEIINEKKKLLKLVNDKIFSKEMYINKIIELFDI